MQHGVDVQSPTVLDLRRFSAHATEHDRRLPGFTRRAVTVEDDGWVVTAQVQRPDAGAPARAREETARYLAVMIDL